MLTLKQAMALHANEIESLKEQMIQDIKAKGCETVRAAFFSCEQYGHE